MVGCHEESLWEWNYWVYNSAKPTLKTRRAMLENFSDRWVKADWYCWFLKLEDALTITWPTPPLLKKGELRPAETDWLGQVAAESRLGFLAPKSAFCHQTFRLIHLQHFPAIGSTVLRKPENRIQRWTSQWPQFSMLFYHFYHQMKRHISFLNKFESFRKHWSGQRQSQRFSFHRWRKENYKAP